MNWLPKMGGGSLHITINGNMVTEDQLRGFVANTYRQMKAGY